MVPRSFDEELTAAAARVRAQDEQDGLHADARRQAEEAERSAEAVRAIVWTELQELGRESAARLRKARIKPPCKLYSKDQGELIPRKGRHKGWRIPVAIRGRGRAFEIHRLILREDGAVGFAKWSPNDQAPNCDVNFPHPIPPQFDREDGDDGLFVHEGQIVVGFNENDHMERIYRHDADVRGALFEEMVRLLRRE